jgi:hypothetical protein
LKFALIEHYDLKEGHHTEVECAVSHDAMLAFNAGQALVDPAKLNMMDGFKKTIVNQMVDDVLKKREEEKTDLIFLVERRRATARKRITDSKTIHAGSWVLGHGHHLGDEAVEISNKNNKERKDAAVRKWKRANEKTKKFDDYAKRVLTESSPEEWASQEDC